MAQEIEIPDRLSDKGFEGINIDKLNVELLNEKNKMRLSHAQHSMKRPELELDFLDQELRKSEVKFVDSTKAASRYGGLQIGDH